MKRVRATSVALLTLGFLAGCHGKRPEAPFAAVRREPPHFDRLDVPPWSPGTGEDDPIVARVGRAAIRLSELQHHVDAHGGALTPRQVLDRLIEFEVMAQEALARNLESAPSVAEVVDQQAVGAMLHDKFVVHHDESAIREEDYEKAWKMRKIRTLFNHYDGYIAWHAQILCCKGDPEMCRKDEEVQTCLEAKEPLAQQAYEELKRQEPFETPEQFKQAVFNLTGLIPGIQPAELRFWYQHHGDYVGQRGMRVYHEGLVKEIMGLEIGHVGKPVRSYHGWHVPVLFEHIPEEHRTLDDPEVRKTIAEHIYPAIQRRDFLKYLYDLEHSVPIEKNYDALAKLTGGATARSTQSTAH